MVLFGRYNKLPLLDAFDVVQAVRNITVRDEGFLDYFIPAETVANRTGKWFFGLVNLKDGVDVDAAVAAASARTCSTTPSPTTTRFRSDLGSGRRPSDD